MRRICCMVWLCGLSLTLSFIFILPLYADAADGSENTKLTLTEKLAYSTVRIQTQLKDGKVGVGTGFFFNLNKDGNLSVPVIVTNWHVVKGSQQGLFSLTMADEKGNPVGIKISSSTILKKNGLGIQILILI